MTSIARSSITRPSSSLHHIQKPQFRFLSTSRPHYVSQQTAAGTAAGNMIKNMPSQPSLATRMKKLKKSEIPSDIGLVPALYVRPCGNMPSWFSQPIVRAQLEWLYTKQTAQDFIGRIYQNRWNQPKDPISGKRKNLRLAYRERYTVARDLHTQLYTAIASGDKKTLTTIACDGLANQQIGKIDHERIKGIAPGSWTVKYRGWVLPSKLYLTIQSLIPSFFKSIHVVADRQIKVPVGQDFVLRQVVLRVDSTQTLRRQDNNVLDKDLREYLVIQMAIIDGEENEWKVWGTIEPTDTKEAFELMQLTKKETGSFSDRMSALWAQSTNR